MKPAPGGVAALAAALAGSPVLHLALRARGVTAAGFGRPGPLEDAAHMGAAPLVALLLAARLPRARSALYILMTLEAFRGLHTGDPWRAALAALVILYFQTPGVRETFPRLRASDVLRRLSGLGRA